MSSSPPVTSEELTPLAKAIKYLPVLVSAVYKSLVFFFQNVAWLLSKISYPIVLLSPHPVILYVFAPVIVFAQLVLGLFVLSPIRVVMYLLDVVYPLYVFCGVACIVGTLVGVTARFVALRLAAVAAPVEEKGVVVKTEEDRG